jgi:broad-specificity NMP kinase
MYAMGCEACERWGSHAVQREQGAVRLQCVNCGHVETRPMRCLPLFIVTGASGVGKTSVVEELQQLLPEWHVFETDSLWDSGRDWQFVRQNWLRVAHRIAQTGRATILCGTHLPEQINACDHRELFSAVHYLILHGADETLAARLERRPAWYQQTPASIAEHLRFNRWLVQNAVLAFDPPAAVVDTTMADVREVAGRIRDWALSCEGGDS